VVIFFAYNRVHLRLMKISHASLHARCNFAVKHRAVVTIGEMRRALRWAFRFAAAISLLMLLAIVAADQIEQTTGTPTGLFVRLPGSFLLRVYPGDQFTVIAWLHPWPEGSRWACAVRIRWIASPRAGAAFVGPSSETAWGDFLVQRGTISLITSQVLQTGNQILAVQALPAQWDETILLAQRASPAVQLSPDRISLMWLRMPTWVLQLLLAVLPLIWLLGFARKLAQQRTVKPGFCANCGYDLRATPQRCPECGHEPNALPKS
jgi:hypothetical protein